MLIKCPECAREVSDSAPSCPGCGYVLSAPAAAAAAPTAEPPPPKPGLSPDMQILIEQRITNEGPNATLAYVLWFFLGIFSAHRFYLGRPGTAILQICCYFILVGFVWLLIDVFLIPGMVRENQSALRQRLRNEALAAHGQAPANPYANLSSYHDPNIVS